MDTVTPFPLINYTSVRRLSAEVCPLSPANPFHPTRFNYYWSRRCFCTRLHQFYYGPVLPSCWVTWKRREPQCRLDRSDSFRLLIMNLWSCLRYKVCSLHPVTTTVKHGVQKCLKSIFKGFIISVCSQEELMNVFSRLRWLYIILCRFYSL